MNKTYPKVAFSLLLSNLLLDNVVGASFIDDFSRYNQNRIVDKEKKTFYRLVGAYCYIVMPFGIKNAGATYHGQCNIFS